MPCSIRSDALPTCGTRVLHPREWRRTSLKAGPPIYWYNEIRLFPIHSGYSSDKHVVSRAASRDWLRATNHRICPWCIRARRVDSSVSGYGYGSWNAWRCEKLLLGTVRVKCRYSRHPGTLVRAGTSWRIERWSVIYTHGFELTSACLLRLERTLRCAADVQVRERGITDAYIGLYMPYTVGRIMIHAVISVQNYVHFDTKHLGLSMHAGAQLNFSRLTLAEWYSSLAMQYRVPAEHHHA